jgi:hypothetical protein
VVVRGQGSEQSALSTLVLAQLLPQMLGPGAAKKNGGGSEEGE